MNNYTPEQLDVLERKAALWDFLAAQAGFEVQSIGGRKRLILGLFFPHYAGEDLAACVEQAKKGAERG